MRRTVRGRHRYAHPASWWRRSAEACASLFEGCTCAKLRAVLEAAAKKADEAKAALEAAQEKALSGDPMAIIQVQEAKATYMAHKAALKKAEVAQAELQGAQQAAAAAEVA